MSENTDKKQVSSIEDGKEANSSETSTEGKKQEVPKKPNPTAGLFALLGDYKLQVFGLVGFLFLSSATSLVIPQIISNAIDTYGKGTFDFNFTLITFSIAAIGIFIFTFAQSLFQTYVSESVARNLRNNLTAKISRLSYLRVQELTSSLLLTNLTSDIDNIKAFISQGIAFLFSSIFLIIGASIFLFTINWRLAIAVLLILPLILGTFMFIFRNIGQIFEKAQKIIDKLNKVISENITASSLIRVLNSQAAELAKFEVVNEESKSIGLSILKLFASVFPIITFLANSTVIVILLLGGYFVLNGEMSLGQFSAFLNYVSILIFPVIILGFLSNLIARAATSYGRIDEVLKSEEDQAGGELRTEIKGNIEFKNVNLNLANRGVLKNISFEIPAGSRTAILGPTAAGKTQIFYLLAKLLHVNQSSTSNVASQSFEKSSDDPSTTSTSSVQVENTSTGKNIEEVQNSGKILIDGEKLENYNNDSLYSQMGLVFQDSVIFNTTIRENISFKSDIEESSLQKAIDTAELRDFINSLPNGLETIVSERGASLSGGQKQRITLARVLSLNPKILLLDDFTARVDNATEKRIFENIKKNYPKITLILITQKISSIEDFDKIILLMEGEILAQGKHEELIQNSLDYQQIFNSQQSTER